MDILTFIIGILILIVVLKIISFPFKLIMKFVINSIIGGVILAILSYIGIGIPIYWWTVALTGILGVPGLVVAIVISIIL